jgi:hypothetical protein
MPLLKRKPNYPMVRRTTLDKATGRRVVVPGSERKIVRQQIEEYRPIGNVELAFVKNIGEPLRFGVNKGDRTLTTGKGRVAPDQELVKNSDITVHTHPKLKLARGQTHAQAFPSANDMLFFFDIMHAKPAQALAIASLGQNEKVAGYTMVKLRKNSGMEREKSIQELDSLMAVVPFHMPLVFAWVFSPEVIREKLKDAGFYLKFVPAKGHYFNKEKFVFERKRLGQRIREKMKRRK